MNFSRDAHLRRPYVAPLVALVLSVTLVAGTNAASAAPATAAPTTASAKQTTAMVDRVALAATAPQAGVATALLPAVLANLRLGKQLAANRRGWIGAKWLALRELWMRESGWRHWAQNPYSSAYGIPQFLDATWATVGIRKTSDPKLQIIAGMRYIAMRYGGPVRALRFHDRHHWYINPVPDQVLFLS